MARSHDTAKAKNRSATCLEDGKKFKSLKRHLVSHA
ncbi:hypothetical protein FJ492_27520 [Mesorhizobium sp. B2-5-4]|nr:hypothetical protein FJ492_27520 [Mesorhizobium sp. B2-5-4]